MSKLLQIFKDLEIFRITSSGAGHATQAAEFYRNPTAVTIDVEF